MSVWQRVGIPSKGLGPDEFRAVGQPSWPILGGYDTGPPDYTWLGLSLNALGETVLVPWEHMDQGIEEYLTTNAPMWEFINWGVAFYYIQDNTLWIRSVTTNGGG